MIIEALDHLLLFVLVRILHIIGAETQIYAEISDVYWVHARSVKKKESARKRLFFAFFLGICIFPMENNVEIGNKTQIMVISSRTLTDH